MKLNPYLAVIIIIELSIVANITNGTLHWNDLLTSRELYVVTKIVI